MKQKNFKPKVAQLDQVKLDFPDIDEDPNLKEAAEELKKRGAQAKADIRVATKRKHAEIENEENTKNPEIENTKRMRVE